MRKMRKPNVKNKYNFKLNDFKKLKLNVNKDTLAKIFWRNDLINAYCFSETTIKNKYDREVGTYDRYIIIIYDNNTMKVECFSYGGICGYRFNEFFKKEDIENIDDLEIQEKLLSKINSLLDEGIVSF